MGGSLEKKDKLHSEKLPRHVAIIMDGNGRWAQRKGLPRTMGHKKGMESIRKVVTTSSIYGIKGLTLYAFSTENWRRPREEVDFLMALPQVYLKRELPELMRNNVKLCFSGRLHKLPDKTQNAIGEATRKTENNKGLFLNIAINYGGRAEITDAVQKIALLVQEKKLDPGNINEDIVAAHMYTAELGDPDLLIRTGGEARLSNFLLWQLAYAELYFTPVLWPDFGKEEYDRALLAYSSRERRFGQLSRELGD
ncbi:MAG: isoprenyl transferase [Firmicutes bacterium]|nr:isoprenyl transferase [Bacillota bacterium]